MELMVCTSSLNVNELTNREAFEFMFRPSCPGKLAHLEGLPLPL